MTRTARRRSDAGTVRAASRLAALTALAALVLSACSATAPVSPDLTGRVAPIVPGVGAGGWIVSAYAAGAGAPQRLAQATTDADGSFGMDVPALADDAVLIVDARPPGQGRALLAAAAPADAASVTLNERTTVAAGYGLAQFFGRDLPSGSQPGLGNAVGMAANLADPSTGAYGDVLTSSPNGTQTETVAAFTSLANALGACLADAGACSTLFEIGAESSRVAPESAAAVFAAVARDPAPLTEELFDLSLSEAGDRPGLSEAPDAWTLALRFDGDGASLAGPGNFALDEDGDIWVNNNYQYDADPQTPVCASDEVFEFSPTGEMTGTYRGGGLSGSGFGIAFDPTGQVWLSNYGFAAAPPGCPEEDQPPHNSMSLFTQDGAALSPDTGFTGGDLSWPQGIAITDDGSVWIANCGNSTVSVYPQGDPEKAQNLGSFGLVQPFDVVDNGEAIFVTGNNSSSVAVIGYDGVALPGSPLIGAFDVPMGITADEAGNVWVANSGGVTLPCPDRNQEGRSTPSVTMISPDGSTLSQPYTGGGVTLPWGITTDGAGNVWVANFTGQRLSAFCGADAAACPRGLETGDPISPASGYGFDGFVRNTGVMVDTAGNVWVTNNWETVPLQTNPAGHQIVAFVGAAAPVDAPTFG